MERTLDVDSYNSGGSFYPCYRNLLNLNKNFKKYLFRHAMVNFYIVNVLGQNLANPESCPILYSENVVRGSGKSVISGNLSRDDYV